MSKSYAQRALIAASLARGDSTVRYWEPLPEDVLVMIRALRRMGIEVSRGHVKGSEPKVPDGVIDVRGSGTSLRLLTSYATIAEDGYTVISGSAGLLRRPVGPLVRAINDLGGWALAARGNLPPVIVKGERMKGGRTRIEEAESSQYVSSLLLVSPYNRSTTTITWKNRVSEHYVRMTVYVMRAFGVEVQEGGDEFVVEPSSYRPASFEVPADASSASFFVIMGLLSGRDVHVHGLRREPLQADLEEILRMLEGLGVRAVFDGSGMSVSGTISAKSLSVNLRNSPDLFPPVSALGCRIPVLISGIEHVRLKESDRIAAMSAELAKLGCRTRYEGGSFEVMPPSRLEKRAKLSGWNDHRVVMALSALCASLGVECEISGYEAVKKSYPTFFTDLVRNGAEVRVVER
ncbi:MAG: 3-phosphoshikimate 1-carboxyvinyltransferase [Nitrososphaeria archaeon]